MGEIDYTPGSDMLREKGDIPRGVRGTLGVVNHFPDPTQCLFHKEYRATDLDRGDTRPAPVTLCNRLYIGRTEGF